MEEINAGYKIIAKETYRKPDEFTEYQIVLGMKETRCGKEFVTWDSIKRAGILNIDYFWGHYFSNENKAKADYHERLRNMYGWEV